ncbi:hypothetical protein EDD86DRAFT_197076 [Gorgonomyces haynaldii]|nr:hypothetical protein EDD86DRAFT_197076 [Gorgonomyces haynaldii]
MHLNLHKPDSTRNYQKTNDCTKKCLKTTHLTKSAINQLLAETADGLFIDTSLTKPALRFRKSKTNACLVLKINAQELTVVEDEYLDDCSIDDIRELLPDSTPRFIVLSFQLEFDDGRIGYPILGIYYNPEATSMNNRMLYASTSQQVFAKAEISGKVFDLVDPEDLTQEWVRSLALSSKTRK